MLLTRVISQKSRRSVNHQTWYRLLWKLSAFLCNRSKWDISFVKKKLRKIFCMETPLFAHFNLILTRGLIVLVIKIKIPNQTSGSRVLKKF